jgi:hypothetical protein
MAQTARGPNRAVGVGGPVSRQFYTQRASSIPLRVLARGASLRDRLFEITAPATVIRPGEVNTLVVRGYSSHPDGGIRERVDGAAPYPEDRRRLPPWAAP